ncbi:sigma-70 family RNA polymerase sigma factor [Sorangium sp. So ce1036]|uniref:RNA polymerase sigma factor n=1 Tax=Sorangium sp. So ce1036 TaxID=3133328 RepID=UPI003F0DE0F2
MLPAVDTPARTPPRFELLRRLARRFGVPERNAEDVAQNALLRGWEARERIEPGGDPTPYSVTIALNQARNHTRNARRRGEVLTSFDDRDLRDECPSAEDLVRRRQREALTRYLIDQVDPKYRDLLIRHELEETPLAEIAAERGLKLETVKTQHRRALEHLEAAKRRWMAQQRSRGWDEEPCVPVALGLYPHEGWTDPLRKIGMRIVVQGAFVVLTGAVVVAPPPSSGTHSSLRPTAVHAHGSAPLGQSIAPPNEQREVHPAITTTAPREQGIAPPGASRDVPPAVVMSGKPASSASTAPGASRPAGAARPTASARERDLIHRARKAIEAHNARADVEARRLLDMHAMEFPRGQLASEREALLLQLR